MHGAQFFNVASTFNELTESTCRDIGMEEIDKGKGNNI
jgi:hypothetical protein